jgi:hypothetical protein
VDGRRRRLRSKRHRDDGEKFLGPITRIDLLNYLRRRVAASPRRVSDIFPDSSFRGCSRRLRTEPGIHFQTV